MDKEILEGEIRWRPIIGYEGYYEVSYCSKVRRLYKTKPKRICKQYLRDRYMAVGLSVNNVVKNHSVHVLVATAFHPNPNNKPTVNHKDGDKMNNHGDNLEWSTRSEQIKHAVNMGLYQPPKPSKGKFGKDHNKSKAVKQYDLSGNLLKSFGGASEAARLTGFSQSGISRAARGECDVYKGFRWNYNTNSLTTKQTEK